MLALKINTRFVKRFKEATESLDKAKFDESID